MDEKELKEKLQKYIDELSEYKDFKSGDLFTSKEFADLIREIQLTIYAHIELKQIFDDKQNYYKNIEENINTIIKDILDKFKSTLKNISPNDLELARNIITDDSQKSFLSGYNGIKEYFFNDLLASMGIEHAYGEFYQFDAKEMLDMIYKYNFSYSDQVFFNDKINDFLYRFRWFNIKTFLGWFYGKLDIDIDINSSLAFFDQKLEEIKELLIIIPRNCYINEFIITKAIFLLFEFKGTNHYCNKEPKYCNFYSNIQFNKKNYISDLTNALKYLKSEVNYFSTRQEKGSFPSSTKSNYKFAKITDGLIKNKISVIYKGTPKAILQSDIRKKIFEYLLSRPNEFGIPPKDIITICGIKSKTPLSPLKTYIHEINSMLRDVHHNKDNKLFITIDSNGNINTNIPL